MIRHTSKILICFALIFVCTASYGHETPIATIDIIERDNNNFLVRNNFVSPTEDWEPKFLLPEQCVADRNFIKCEPPGLVGNLSIEQIGENFSGAVIRLQRKDQSLSVFTLSNDKKNIFISEDSFEARLHTIRVYTVLGIEHILIGLDHLAFVLGLSLLFTRLSTAVKTISAFTIAHSITLGISAVGHVTLPIAIVEALIALSISTVAAEKLLQSRGYLPWSNDKPMIIGFMFGLLHGFGFASVLTDLGLPKDSALTSLFSFNIGVEIGQIIFVCLVFACLFGMRRFLSLNLYASSQNAVAYLIGILGLFWAIERTVAIVT